MNTPFIEIKRKAIRELLNQCTVEQVVAFNILYGSIDTILEKDMDSAYIGCQIVVLKNVGARE